MEKEEMLKEYDKLAEENEFFGLPYDKDTDTLIKLFLIVLLEKFKEETKYKLPDILLNSIID
jgi:hypothetical protein